MQFLPADWRSGTFAGRMNFGEGPTPVLIRNGRVMDVSRQTPTVSALLEKNGALPSGDDKGDLEDFHLSTAWAGAGGTKLLAPVDLQCVKAAGVTFAVSAVERVIEERARGQSGNAETIRKQLEERLGGDIRSVVPGSAEAARLKGILLAEGLWSQYLEVAIGPDAEVFTKAPLLASVGWGDFIGVRSDSSWNNPEPEIVIVCNRSGAVVGATLGNDVNLRDFEGRSALLLGKAKDNNASCSLGPFIRLFDETYSIDDVRKAEVFLEISGTDNFRLEGRSSMSQISRDPLDLAKHVLSEHQYPDGFALFLGTLFVPSQDRRSAGKGFTHMDGDIVRVSTPKLGMLENKVTTCKQAPPWNFGVLDLFNNLAARGLLKREAD